MRPKKSTLYGGAHNIGQALLLLIQTAWSLVRTEREADKIKAKAQDEVAEILRAADDIELEARFTRDDAIAFKQQMEADAEAEAAQMRQQQAQFLSLVKEKISNITVETAMETGILDLSSY